MKQKNFLHGIFLHEICGGSSSKAMAASSLSVREFKLRVFFSRKRQVQSREHNFVASVVCRFNVKVSYFTFAVDVK